MESRILLVDDEPEILDMISIVLRKEGFTHIEIAENGQQALVKAKQFYPHLIVLDVMLPDGEGFDFCRRLRDFTDVPIIFVTAKNTDLNKLTGFQMGGDDYLTKPFHPLELVARIRAQLRRMRSWHSISQTSEVIYDFGHFFINETAGQLLVEGIEVSCPAMEFKLLAFLCANPNRVFSKQQLYEQVWQEGSMGDDNTVIVHIRRLREKIESNPSHPKWLITVRGLGYKLVSPQ